MPPPSPTRSIEVLASKVIKHETAVRAQEWYEESSDIDRNSAAKKRKAETIDAAYDEVEVVEDRQDEEEKSQEEKNTEMDERKWRRIMSNRRSAYESRERRRKRMADLEKAVKILTKENTDIRRENQFIRKQLSAVAPFVDMDAFTRHQMRAKTGPAVPPTTISPAVPTISHGPPLIMEPPCLSHGPPLVMAPPNVGNGPPLMAPPNVSHGPPLMMAPPNVSHERPLPLPAMQQVARPHRRHALIPRRITRTSQELHMRAMSIGREHGHFA